MPINTIITLGAILFCMNSFAESKDLNCNYKFISIVNTGTETGSFSYRAVKCSNDGLPCAYMTKEILTANFCIQFGGFITEGKNTLEINFSKCQDWNLNQAVAPKNTKFLTVGSQVLGESMSITCKR